MMDTAQLRKGSRGSQVLDLQRRLARLGFDPGPLDGVFGRRTERAVRQFQQSAALTVDGVAGPATFAALESRENERPECDVSAETVMLLFPAAAAQNIQRNLPLVHQALAAEKLGDRDMLLVALATIRAECEGFAPVDEAPSTWNTSPGGHPFDLYDNRANLGNLGPPDGERYRGRGYVQLTGRYNYGRYGEAIGLGDRLLLGPELANDPAIAARLLAAFLKDKEDALREAVQKADLAAARRLVNGGGHGLDRFTDVYQRGLALFAAPERALEV
jgi:peptidoglycan L-alanyl-D-glutamate endopeptidase CwlK